MIAVHLLMEAVVWIGLGANSVGILAVLATTDERMHARGALCMGVGTACIVLARLATTA